MSETNAGRQFSDAGASAPEEQLMPLWWQVDRRWHHRGIGANKLVMARFGDRGPYSPDNVQCITHSKNIADIDRTHMGEKIRRAWEAKAPEERARHHLCRRGDGHPKSKPVITPKGRFGSMALAAEAFGITRAGGFYKVKRGEWHYEAAPPMADPDFKLAAD